MEKLHGLRESINTMLLTADAFEVVALAAAGFFSAAFGAAGLAAAGFFSADFVAAAGFFSVDFLAGAAFLVSFFSDEPEAAGAAFLSPDLKKKSNTSKVLVIWFDWKC